MGAPETIAYEKPPLELTRSRVMCRQLVLLTKIHGAALMAAQEAVQHGAPTEAPLALAQWADEGVSQILDIVKAERAERDLREAV